MLKILCTIAGLAMLSTSAQAQDWFTKTEEDVFSGKNTATMIGGVNRSESVYFACDADHASLFAVIAKFKDEKTSGISGVAVAKIDGGETMRFDVVSYTHNENYLGFATTDSAAALALVEAVGKARKSILFGLEVAAVDTKFSFSVSPSGSSKAAAQYMKACKD